MEIRDLATTLIEKISEIVPERPTYWNGTPRSYDFPLSDTDFLWLWNAVHTLIGNLTPDEADDDDEAVESDRYALHTIGWGDDDDYGTATGE